MNIAFVNSTRKWGGVKTWCIDTAKGLESVGVHSIIFGSDSRFLQRATHNALQAYPVHFGPDYNPFAITFFLNYFKKHKVSHVIVNVGKDIKSAGIAARILGLPMIIHVGSPGDIANKIENKLLHSFLRPSFVCCSNFTCRHFTQNLPYVTRFRVAAIHPGVTIPDHEISLSRPPTIITTSQLNADKRHKDLIEACKILADRNVDFQVKIVGEGECAPSLKQMVYDLGLNERITFTGYVDDVSRELRSADIFVLPSRCEPLGIALEEAMANGLIPVARNAGGAPEIWPDFLDTLLPAESRGEEFSNMLEKILFLPQDHMLELKHTIRAHAMATFSIEHQSQKFLEFMNPKIFDYKHV
jgi:glycosyltransferase involved in cell wall biosynthesis